VWKEEGRGKREFNNMQGAEIVVNRVSFYGMAYGSGKNRFHFAQPFFAQKIGGEKSGDGGGEFTVEKHQLSQ